MMITRVVTTVMVTIMTMTVMMMTVIHYSDAGYCFIMLQCNISQGPSVSNAATISKPLVRKYITQRRDIAAELAVSMHPLVRWLTPHRQHGCLLVSAGMCFQLLVNIPVHLLLNQLFSSFSLFIG